MIFKLRYQSKFIKIIYFEGERAERAALPLLPTEAGWSVAAEITAWPAKSKYSWNLHVIGTLINILEPPPKRTEPLFWHKSHLTFNSPSSVLHGL